MPPVSQGLTLQVLNKGSRRRTPSDSTRPVGVLCPHSRFLPSPAHGPESIYHSSTPLSRATLAGERVCNLQSASPSSRKQASKFRALQYRVRLPGPIVNVGHLTTRHVWTRFHHVTPCLLRTLMGDEDVAHFFVQTHSLGFMTCLA